MHILKVDTNEENHLWSKVPILGNRKKYDCRTEPKHITGVPVIHCYAFGSTPISKSNCKSTTALCNLTPSLPVICEEEGKTTYANVVSKSTEPDNKIDCVADSDAFPNLTTFSHQTKRGETGTPSDTTSSTLKQEEDGPGDTSCPVAPLFEDPEEADASAVAAEMTKVLIEVECEKAPNLT